VLPCTRRLVGDGRWLPLCPRDALRSHAAVLATRIWMLWGSRQKAHAIREERRRCRLPRVGRRPWEDLARGDGLLDTASGPGLVHLGRRALKCRGVGGGHQERAKNHDWRFCEVLVLRLPSSSRTRERGEPGNAPAADIVVVGGNWMAPGEGPPPPRMGLAIRPVLKAGAAVDREAGEGMRTNVSATSSVCKRSSSKTDPGRPRSGPSSKSAAART
jgi:hypothetical protein